VPQQLNIFPDGTLPHKPAKNDSKVVNVSSVPQRSPFRYPGGKTWFVPTFRKWMAQFESDNTKLIEPFVGGGIISLTAAFENLSHEVLMVELDDEISAVWETIINRGQAEWLANRIVDFDLTIENAKKVIEDTTSDTKSKAFKTILKNRIYHGGILAGGSGMLKHGENGKGIASRWYPETLHKRITNIGTVADRIVFQNGDAFEVINNYANEENVVYFIDPPYTKAGRRLYTHHEIDDQELLTSLSKVKGSFLITYDDSQEIVDLVEKLSLEYRRIPMRTTHHVTKYELIISNNFDWF